MPGEEVPTIETQGVPIVYGMKMMTTMVTPALEEIDDPSSCLQGRRQ
jgi:hypothetical protein